MTPIERVYWAFSLQVKRDHGANGPKHIAEQVDTAELKGRQHQVALWKGVAQRYGQLQRTERQLVV